MYGLSDHFHQVAKENKELRENVRTLYDDRTALQKERRDLQEQLEAERVVIDRMVSISESILSDKDVSVEKFLTLVVSLRVAINDVKKARER